MKTRIPTKMWVKIEKVYLLRRYFSLRAALKDNIELSGFDKLGIISNNWNVKL